MAVKISIAKGNYNPTSNTGLTLGEPAFNYSNNTLWMGKGSGNSPVWLGAGVCGASGGIAAGITYQIPTLGAVKDYFSAVSSAFLGSTVSYVATFNGATGAVTGVTVGGANTFTALQIFNSGISASDLVVSGGVTFGPYSYIAGGGLGDPNTPLNPVTIDSAKVQIGDIDGAVNGLKFVIDSSNPDTNTARLYGNLIVQATQAPYGSGGGIYSSTLNTDNINPNSSTTVQIGNSSNRVSIGDNGEGNGTKIYIRDATQTLDLINANGIINIGDVNGAANSTKLIVDDSTGQISLNGQVTANAFTSLNDVVFGAAFAFVNSETTTLGTTAADQIIASVNVFDESVDTNRSVEFFVQASHSSGYEALKILAIHDGINTYNTQYGLIRTGSSLCSSYTTTIVNVNESIKQLRLRATPTNTNTTFKVIKTVIPA